MESIAGNESLGEKEGARLDKRRCIHVHSNRHRLTDPDGISAKAVIDGLREASVLVDDTARYVKEVSFSQALVEADGEEFTIVSIYFE